MLKLMPLKHSPAFVLAILHGSQATGHASERSDWDVAVLADHALTRDERAEFRQAFAERFGISEEKLDLSDLRSDSPLLRYRVAMHGKLIAGDPREFVGFQIRAWKDYLNNEKMMDLQAAFLNKALS